MLEIIIITVHVNQSKVSRIIIISVHVYNSIKKRSLKSLLPLSINLRPLKLEIRIINFVCAMVPEIPGVALIAPPPFYLFRAFGAI